MCEEFLILANCDRTKQDIVVFFCLLEVLYTLKTELASVCKFAIAILISFRVRPSVQHFLLMIIKT